MHKERVDATARAEQKRKKEAEAERRRALDAQRDAARALLQDDLDWLDYDEDEGFLLDHPSWGISC